MNKIKFLILAFAVNLISFGQINTEADLIGKWAVNEMIDKPTEAQFKPILEAFEKSTFNFKPNKQIEITTTNATELFNLMKMEIFNEEAKWQFDESEQLVRIGNENEGFSWMIIKIKSNNEEPIFHIEETELTMRLRKL